MNKWLYIVIFVGALMACNQNDSNKEADLRVVETREEMATSKSEAIVKVVEDKLRERFEKVRLAQQYPAFDVLETDTPLFRKNISNKTVLQTFKIVDSYEKGDTLTMMCSVALRDSLHTQEELIRAQWFSKISTIDGEQLVTREIHFENAAMITKTQTNK